MVGEELNFPVDVCCNYERPARRGGDGTEGEGEYEEQSERQREESVP